MLNCDGAFTVNAIIVLALAVPPVPSTVNEYGPGVTVDATLIVTAELLVAGLVPNVPVIPAGQPDAANVTAELKTFTEAIVTVEVPATLELAEAAVALSVKLGWPPDTVNVPNFCQDPIA